jgi:3-oxoacyl-[acyl-carrier-protein] synthase II
MTHTETDLALKQRSGRTSEDVWITGIGLVSSLGEGVDAHLEQLGAAATTQPVIESTRFAPYPVHPIVPLDYSKQIPKRSDQNQMETWQRIGTYAAGLALADAGIAKNRDVLDKAGLVVAAGIGERDAKVDTRVLETMDESADADLFAKQVLPSALKPTLFLAQLSNLLAGNISIIHNVTGSSRTFMGEEMAGISAVENAVRRIRAGQGEVFLVGGACNAERADLMLPFELGRMLWSAGHEPVWCWAARARSWWSSRRRMPRRAARGPTRRWAAWSPTARRGRPARARRRCGGCSTASAGSPRIAPWRS